MESLGFLELRNRELSATVDALHKTLSTVIKSASADTDFESMMIEKAKSVLSATPQQHLRNVRAEAVCNFIEFMYNSKDCQLCSNSLDVARKYAEQLKGGKL